MDSQLYELNNQSALGQKLRIAREQKKYSQREVARALNLSPHIIDAIEREDYMSLPEPVYVKGYIRNYAELLNIADDIMISSVHFTDLHPEIKSYENIPSVRVWKVNLAKYFHQSFNIVTLLILGVIIFVAWHERHHDNQIDQSDLLFKHLAVQVVPFQKKSENIVPDVNNAELLKQIQPWKSP
jgi:cytoskeletal protein RodZ